MFQTFLSYITLNFHNVCLQKFEYVLRLVKSSHLNFHIQETPFAAIISIKKTLVENKFGQCLNPSSLDSNFDRTLKAENHELHDRIVKLENYASSLKTDLEEEVDGNEKRNIKFEKIVNEKETEIINLEA